LFCGRVTFDKGVFELFNAIGQIRNSLKINVKLSVVGFVDETTKRKLMEIAILGNFYNDVEWFGFIPFGIGLLAQFKKSHICILPSFHEGFPHTIWEAGICSTPMITTNVGGIKGMVSEDEVTFIEPRSIKSIVDAVLFLKTNELVRKSRTENLYKLASQYTLEKNAIRLFEILSKN
jgi:glycosyltransferase involved in cell wall biosynthesis